MNLYEEIKNMSMDEMSNLITGLVVGSIIQYKDTINVFVKQNKIKEFAECMKESTTALLKSDGSIYEGKIECEIQ
jgi:hypothetical protein